MGGKLAPFETECSNNGATQHALEAEGLYNLARRPSDDGISLVSFQSQKTSSTTDGIDFVGDHRPDTFASWTGGILKDIRFKRAVVSFIILDSILMGIATFDFVTESDELSHAAAIVNSVFLCLFSIELLIRLVHCKFRFLHDGWLVFDVVVISCSWIFSLLVVVRTFRVVRTLRLATRIKELRNIILTLQEVIPKIMAVAFILLLSFYIFSIMFTDLYKDLYKDGYTDRDYFSRIDVTAFTLFQIMTLDQWSIITNEVQAAHSWAWVLFFSFVVSSSFFILNLTIAVIYEGVIRVQHKQSGGPMVAAEGASNTNPDCMERLEQKVDRLAESVELLLRKQMIVQSSISDMSPSVIT